MAFSNYYIKIGKSVADVSSSTGGYKIPLSKMAVDTYHAKPEIVQDLDPYTDANGELHRNPMSHTSANCSFSTPVMLETEYLAFWQTIRNQCVNLKKRDYYVSFYHNETGAYTTPALFYMAEPEHSPKGKDAYGRQLMNSTTIEFIKY